jgi:hypothetical protein
MIKPTTLLALLVLGGSATGLYQLKYDVASLRDRAQSLAQTLDSERQAIHVLSAEWAYLNRPERLAELVKRHLDLVPLAADQIIPADAIPPRGSAQGQIAEADSETGAGDTGDKGVDR